LVDSPFECRAFEINVLSLMQFVMVC